MNLIEMYRLAMQGRVEDPRDKGNAPMVNNGGYSYPNSIHRPVNVQDQRMVTHGPLWNSYFGPQGHSQEVQPNQPGYDVEQEAMNYRAYMQQHYINENNKAPR